MTSEKGKKEADRKNNKASDEKMTPGSDDEVQPIMQTNAAVERA